MTGVSVQDMENVIFAVHQSVQGKSVTNVKNELKKIFHQVLGMIIGEKTID